jgi:hypothetical protein
MDIRHAAATCLKITATVCITLAVTSQPVIARGGYGYHYGHGFHGHHHGFHARYGHHGGFGTAGAVVLGLLGIAVLAHVLDDDHYDRRSRVARSKPLPAYPRLDTAPQPYPRVDQHPASPPGYESSEGWSSLIKGDADKAMTIFAVLSQQDLNSGVPKVGFALATAANNELERAIWSMHRALKQDPEALNLIPLDSEMENLIGDLKQTYHNRAKKMTGPSHEAFMTAALAYLQQDYATAQSRILEASPTAGTENLQHLIAARLQ